MEYELIIWNGDHIITFSYNSREFNFYINHKVIDSFDILYIKYCEDSLNCELASHISILIKCIILEEFPNIKNYSILWYSDKLFLEKYMNHSAKIFNMVDYKFEYLDYYGIISSNSQIENHILNITLQLSEIEYATI
jgi:hypothetical protein